MRTATTRTTTMLTTTSTASSVARLARLLQLASPALPVGAYSYSQGLEAAVEAGVVTDATSAGRWIGDVLEHSLARYEAPALGAFLRAWATNDVEAARGLNERFLASRESAELRAETVQMGYSLARLAPDLGLDAVPLEEPAFPAAWSWCAGAWQVPPQEALVAYLWAWAENQAMAALKAVPLGQTDGQKLLAALGAKLEAIAAEAAALPEAAWCNFTPRLALLSARHETQYSRLFRS